MLFVTKCEFEDTLISEDSNFLSGYFSEIYKCYLGYKQCYSRELENDAVMAKLTDKTDDDLYLRRYAAYKQWCLDVHRVELEDSPMVVQDDLWLPYLKMCWFIHTHMNHESPLEHIAMQFRFTHMSRACQQQLTRHRTGITFSIQSQRYVPFFKDNDDAELYFPTTIYRKEEARELYTKYLDDLAQVAQQLRNLGIKEEDIRYLYPNAMTGDGVMSINFRALKHFLAERCCSRAQTEIRQFAKDLLEHCLMIFPFMGTHLGAKCLEYGICTEAKSCGVVKRRKVFTAE